MLYDGEVNFDDLTRFEYVDEMDNSKMYTAVVINPRFKRTLRVALLFSTDLSQSARDIEFLVRDAKQFLGLNDCQSCRSESLHFHFNASMTALNLLKLEDRELRHNVISISSWKTRKANAYLLEHFSLHLGLDFNTIKSRPDFADLCNYGVIAA